MAFRPFTKEVSRGGLFTQSLSLPGSLGTPACWYWDFRNVPLLASTRRTLEGYHSLPCTGKVPEHLPKVELQGGTN